MACGLTLIVPVPLLDVFVVPSAYQIPFTRCCTATVPACALPPTFHVTVSFVDTPW